MSSSTSATVPAAARPLVYGAVAAAMAMTEPKVAASAPLVEVEVSAPLYFLARVTVIAKQQSRDKTRTFAPCSVAIPSTNEFVQMLADGMGVEPVSLMECRSQFRDRSAPALEFDLNVAPYTLTQTPVLFGSLLQSLNPGMLSREQAMVLVLFLDFIGEVTLPSTTELRPVTETPPTTGSPPTTGMSPTTETPERRAPRRREGAAAAEETPWVRAGSRRRRQQQALQPTLDAPAESHNDRNAQLKRLANLFLPASIDAFQAVRTLYAQDDVMATMSCAQEVGLWALFAYEGFSRLIPRNVLSRVRTYFLAGRVCCLKPFTFLQHLEIPTSIAGREGTPPETITQQEMAFLELVRAYRSVVPAWSAEDLAMYKAAFLYLLDAGSFGALEEFVKLFPNDAIRWWDYDAQMRFFAHVAVASPFPRYSQTYEELRRQESDDVWREFMLVWANRLRRLLRALLGRTPTLADVPRVYATNVHDAEEDVLLGWEEWLLEKITNIDYRNRMVLIWTAYGEDEVTGGTDVLTQLKTRPPYMSLRARIYATTGTRSLLDASNSYNYEMLVTYLLDATATS